MARESKKTSRSGFQWRLWLGLAILAGVCVSTGMAALRVRRFAANSAQFTLSRYQKGALQIDGLRYASRARVLHVFSGDFGHSIFSVPLDERRRRLLAIDWIEEASVSRIWPDRLAIRIRERRPVAFVYFRDGLLLIDAGGVLLDPPPQAQFNFPMLSGVREDDDEGVREEHVRAMLRLEDDMGYQAKDISEVNTDDLDNLRIVAKVDNRAIELIMGDGNFGRRYQNFLGHYQEIKKQSPDVKTFDLRLDDRITAKD
jgi:cell division protein FtsQ